MARLNDIMKSGFLRSPAVRSTAIAIGVAVLVPIAAKALAPLVRPVARSTVKIGVVAYEKGRETIAEIGEIVEDMVAEVREELRAEREEQAVFPEEGDSGTDIIVEAPVDGRNRTEAA